MIMKQCSQSEHGTSCLLLGEPSGERVGESDGSNWASRPVSTEGVGDRAGEEARFSSIDENRGDRLGGDEGEGIAVDDFP